MEPIFVLWHDHHTQDRPQGANALETSLGRRGTPGWMTPAPRAAIDRGGHPNQPEGRGRWPVQPGGEQIARMETKIAATLARIWGDAPDACAFITSDGPRDH